MSVIGASRCPRCSGRAFHEVGRVEAAEFGPHEPPEDLAIYRCDGDDCGHEFTSDEEGAR